MQWKTIQPEMSALRERLAAIEHERWSKWQAYLFSLCEKRDDGSLIIPAEKVERWRRQIDTEYEKLSKHEKDSDRHQVDNYWHLIVGIVVAAVFAEKKRIIDAIRKNEDG